MMRWVVVVGFMVACGGGGTLDSADPCAELELPACPEECPDDYAATCGEQCEEEGEECGNAIGDGRVCQDGLWRCSVHAPLGTDGECNRVCN